MRKGTCSAVLARECRVANICPVVAWKRAVQWIIFVDNLMYLRNEICFEDLVHVWAKDCFDPV